MFVIQEFRLPLATKFSLEIPVASVYLEVKMQGDTPFLCAMVDPEADMIEKEFRFIDAGESFEREGRGLDLQYIGSVQDDEFTRYLFENILFGWD